LRLVCRLCLETAVLNTARRGGNKGRSALRSWLRARRRPGRRGLRAMPWMGVERQQRGAGRGGEKQDGTDDGHREQRSSGRSTRRRDVTLGNARARPAVARADPLHGRNGCEQRLHLTPSNRRQRLSELGGPRERRCDDAQVNDPGRPVVAGPPTVRGASTSGSWYHAHGGAVPPAVPIPSPSNLRPPSSQPQLTLAPQLHQRSSPPATSEASCSHALSVSMVTLRAIATLPAPVLRLRRAEPPAAPQRRLVAPEAPSGRPPWFRAKDAADAMARRRVIQPRRRRRTRPRTVTGRAT